MAMLRWWALVCSVVVVTLILAALGLFGTLWAYDLSKLSFLNLALFAGTTAFIGTLTYRWHRGGDRTITKYLPMCWLLADTMMGVGMMGTLLGFLMMFTANVSHIDFTNIDTAKQILGQLTRGTTTAVVTTFVGLVLSTITKLQLGSLEQDLPDEA